MRKLLRYKQRNVASPFPYISLGQVEDFKSIFFSVAIALESTRRARLSGWKPDVGYTVYITHHAESNAIMVRDGLSIGPGIRPVIKIQNIQRKFLGRRWDSDSSSYRVAAWLYLVQERRLLRVGRYANLTYWKKQTRSTRNGPVCKFIWSKRSFDSVHVTQVRVHQPESEMGKFSRTIICFEFIFI